MVYRFRPQLAPDAMVFDADPDPTRQEWYPRASSDRDGPIEDWMREYYPRTLSVDPRQFPLKHWGIGPGAMYCVSATVKALIDQLEPNVHQFLDAELRRGADQYPYYILKFGHSIDCVDVEASDVLWGEGRAGDRTVRYWTAHKPLVIKRQLVAGMHLWQSKTPPDLKFLSDHLHDLLDANGCLSGLRCERQHEV